jgi:hypothetical protein
MDKVHKPITTQYYTPSSKPFTAPSLFLSLSIKSLKFPVAQFIITVNSVSADLPSVQFYQHKGFVAVNNSLWTRQSLV